MLVYILAYTGIVTLYIGGVLVMRFIPLLFRKTNNNKKLIIGL